MITYLHDNAIMHVVKIPIEDVFQALSDSTRLRIVRLMAVTNEEACLCELVDSLLEPQYKLSRHLKILRQAGLLDSEKEGEMGLSQAFRKHGVTARSFRFYRCIIGSQGPICFRFSSLPKEIGAPRGWPLSGWCIDP